MFASPGGGSATGGTADPERVTIRVPALSVNVNVADLSPAAAGAKITCRLQVATAGIDSGQLFATRNSLLLGPVSVREVIWTFTFPVFVRVMACGVLIVFAVCVGKDSAEDESVIGMSPVPVALIVWGLVIALSLTAIVPLRVPPAVGAKVTEIVQVPPAGTLVPQLLV